MTEVERWKFRREGDFLEEMSLVLVLQGRRDLEVEAQVALIKINHFAQSSWELKKAQAPGRTDSILSILVPFLGAQGAL